MPTDEPRPIEVPLDWVNVDCQNPACNLTVWIPPDIGSQVEGTPVLAVCSAECAMVLTKSLG